MKVAKGKGTGKKDTTTKDALKSVENKNLGKRKAVAKPDAKSKKVVKTKNDPNKPKKPASAFFVFLEEFRKTYKLENPNVKGVSAVGKAGGAKWQILSKSEKAPYEAEAAERKTDYEKQMRAYDKKKDTTADDDGERVEEASEKPKPRGHGDTDESEEEDDDEEDDD